MSDLHDLSASQLSEAFAAGLSPVTVVEALLARIRSLDPVLNVFIHLDADGALRAARIAEAELRQGFCRGPLHGVPVGVKDIFDVANMATTCHSAVLRDNIATADAEAVRRLRNAGAVVLGKLATYEFAMAPPSFDLPFPPARNPWNPAHHPGGSSSGSGAGIAAGFFPLALGSDTGGSIRHPAAACGIVGLKPTYGLVSRRGVFPLAQTLDHIGPLARTVKDAALALEILAGHDPADPGSVPRPAGTYDRDLKRGLRGMRIGFIRHFHEQDHVCDPEVGAALEDAAKMFAAEGALVETITLPPLARFTAAHAAILYAESWSIHAAWMRERPQDYGAPGRRRLLAGAFLSAEDVVAAQRARLKLIAHIEDALSRYDVLLCANLFDPPVKIDDEAELKRTLRRQARAPFNLSGHPAISLMTGLSKSGLPLSMQLVGRYFDETTLLGVAAAFERATPWHEMRPKLAVQ